MRIRTRARQVSALRRASSTSSRSLWLALRNRTAWRRSGTLASRLLGVGRIALLAEAAGFNAFVDQLAAGGLVARAEDPSDRRAKVLSRYAVWLGDHREEIEKLERDLPPGAGQLSLLGGDVVPFDKHADKNKKR